MKKLALLLTILILMMSSGCGNDAAQGDWPFGDRAGETANIADTPVTRAGNYPSYTDKDGTWAVYLYICGSNLESDDPEDDTDPFGMASIDISETVQVAMPENVNVIMQTGGALNWQNNLDPNKLIRLRHGADGTYELDAAPLASMGDPNTLTDFLTFCNTNYPAEHQVVVLWDHGGGSLFGYACDENFDDDALSLQELGAAFAAAPAASGKYEIIGFDACLMATIDVVAALKDYGNYLVASEETEPLPGWYYTGALQALADDTSQPASQFARAICDTYYEGLLDLHELDERINLHQNATLSVIDLNKADSLLEAYEAMADEALLLAVQQKETYLSQFSRAARTAENYGSNTPETGFFEMVDLGDLVDNAAELLPQSKPKVEAALRDCVVYQVKGPLRPDASGVSCYYCYSGSPNSVAFYSETGSAKAVSYYHEYSLNGALSQEGLQYVNGLDIQQGQPPLPMEELSPVTELGLEGFPVAMGADGHWRLELGPERAKSVAAVYNYMLLDFGGGVQVLFGVSNEVDADWQNGVFTEQYSGMWGCIDDAQLFMRAASIGDGYIVYSSPILLNGIEHNLFVSLEYDSSGKEKYTILGVRRVSENVKSMETKEPAAKDMAQLESGDVLEPLHYFLIQEDNGERRLDSFSVQSITIGENPKFYEKSLGNGHFQIMFDIIDYAGNEYLSSPGDFKVKEGKIERTQGWTTYPQPAGTVEWLSVSKNTDSFNPNAKSPYYMSILNMQYYTDIRASLGLPFSTAGDQMTIQDGMGGGFVAEIFTNDPSINLEDYIGEQKLYMTGNFIDGRQTRQRDVAFEVTGIMAAEGGTGGSIASGTLAGHAGSASPSSASSSNSATITGLWGTNLTDSEKYVFDTAAAVLGFIKNKDFGALGHSVHPTRGLTFSPYGFIDTATAVCLGVGDVIALGNDNSIRTWGTFDGSGEPIKYTFAEYYDRFILSQDFTQAPQIGINRIIKTGEGNNLNVFGNGGAYVEFHIPGTPPNADHNWGSLRLVFADHEGELYLVGIVHDGWTV